MEDRFNRNLKLGYSFSFFMLTAVGVLCYFAFHQLTDSNGWVSHSNLVIYKLERTSSLMKDAETGQRGYLLTGRDQFLEPYHGSYERALALVNEASELTRDNVVQQRNIAAIHQVMVKRMTILQQLIDKKRHGSAINESDLDAGKAAMDELRRAVNKAENDEQGLLAQRAVVLNRYVFWTPILIINAIVLAFAIALFSYINVRRDINEKERLRAELEYKEQETAAFNEELTAANEEIRAANEELSAINEELTEAREELALLNHSLEQKVNERTAALQQTEEELQAINEEMSAANEELVSTNEELHQSRENLEQMVAKLEASELRSHGIVAAAPFPIGVYAGREMQIVMANQAIVDVWAKGNDVIGKTYHELLPELAGQEIYEQLHAVFVTGEPFHARSQRVDLIVDGHLQPFYFNYSFTALRDADGSIYGVMNTAAEITDLVLAKQQVEQSEKNLKAIIAQAPVAMCILSGPEHVITVANPLMIEIWGKPEAEVINKPVFNALPDARGQGLEEVMQNVYQTGKTFYASELPVSLIRHGKPEVVYQNFVYQAYRDAVGSISGVMAITIDVTEQVLARKQIEQSEAELRETKKRLEAELTISQQVQQQKDDFIGMASHELKTPLTSLSAMIQVAQLKLKSSADPFLEQAMGKATLQVRRMISMINGFLNISRLESGKILIEKQEFDLDRLISDVMDEIRLTGTGHQLVYISSGPLNVYADRDKMASVISNLIGNAVKYSPKKSLVSVTCTTTVTEVIVSVKDGGMGIKQQDIDKIFDRYYRVQSQNTQHIAGFGIGLYLSAEIVTRHEGRIWVESEIGVGSIFHFSLPLRS